MVGMAIRVVQWATGGVGRAAIEGVLAHPDLELVGAWVHSESKHGKDVGALIGRDPIGVKATTSMDDILAMDADCVVYSPLLPNEDEVVALLRSGKNVVTPVGWVYPRSRHLHSHPRRLRRGRKHAARHRYSPRRYYRTIPADGVGTERGGDARTVGGVQ